MGGGGGGGVCLPSDIYVNKSSADCSRVMKTHTFPKMLWRIQPYIFQFFIGGIVAMVTILLIGASPIFYILWSTVLS